VTGLSLDYVKELRERDGNSFPAAGTINAEVTSKGNLTKNDINFNLSASGQNISIHNEPIVNPILIVDAVTGEKAKVDLTATVRDQPHHITGNIDLLNDDGPILHAEEVLNNTSLAPYLALLGGVPGAVRRVALGSAAPVVRRPPTQKKQRFALGTSGICIVNRDPRTYPRVGTFPVGIVALRPAGLIRLVCREADAGKRHKHVHRPR